MIIVMDKNVDIGPRLKLLCFMTNSFSGLDLWGYGLSICTGPVLEGLCIWLSFCYHQHEILIIFKQGVPYFNSSQGPAFSVAGPVNLLMNFHFRNLPN